MRGAEAIAERTGCFLDEAEAALSSEPDPSRAEAAVLAVLQHRRRRYIPRLTGIWNQFCVADGAILSGDDDTKPRANQNPIAREIGVDGTIEFVSQGLGLDLEDVVVLAVAYELKSPSVAKFTYQGFLDGWGRLSCSTLPEMATYVQSKLRKQLNSDEEYFGKVYRFCFGYILPEGSRLLPLDTAEAYWRLLMVSRYAIAAKWSDFARAQGRAVSGDTWNMVFEFCKYAAKDPLLSEYDETSAWPAIIDDFVENYKSSQ